MSNLKHLNQARSAAQRWARAALVTAPLLAFALLTAAPTANANGYRSGHQAGHYDRGHNRHQSRHYNHRAHRGYRGYYQPRYRSSRHDNRGAYLIGGLVVGSLITHAITNNRNDYRVDSRQERYTTQSYDPSKSYSAYSAGRDADAPVSRRLFRDAQGNCFERQTGADNQELLIDLPAEECRW